MSLKDKSIGEKIDATIAKCSEVADVVIKKVGDVVEDVKENYRHQCNNDTIFQRLEKATESEKRELCEILKLEYNPNISSSYLSEKYREAAGHSIVNIIRSPQNFPYKQILIDVADKLKPGVGWTKFKLDDEFTEDEIEDEILKSLAIKFDKQFQKLSAEKKKEVEDKIREHLEKKGVKQATINSTIIALSSGGIGAAMAGTVAGTFFGGQALIAFLTYAFGPATIVTTTAYIAPTVWQVALSGASVGTAVGIPLLAVTLGGPAYRKTIPATLKLMAIRKRYEYELSSKNTNN